MEQKKTAKYFKYAIGEIILVVIGILIALQINNTNEQRIKDIEANKLLIQIQEDLLVSIKKLEEQRIYYKQKDSTYNIIISDTLKVSDLTNPKNYRISKFTFDFAPYVLKNEGYKSFISKSDQFSETYSSLEPLLKKLYSEFEFYYTASQKEIQNVLDRQYAYARNQNWYPNVWSSKNLKKEFAEYLLYDFKYKNEARTYHEFIQANVGVTIRFQMHAVQLYKKLQNITQHPSKTPKEIQVFYQANKEENLKRLIGVYYYADKKRKKPLIIKYKNGQLYANDKRAYLKSKNEIIIEDFPSAYIYTYNAADNSLIFNLLNPKFDKMYKEK